MLQNSDMTIYHHSSIAKITPLESIAGLSELRPTFLFVLLQMYLRRPRQHLSVYTTAYLLRIISSSFGTNLLNDTR